MNKILVVAAHPDDEILGVGGTVAKLKENGDIVHCLILGEGQTSRFSNRNLVDKQILNDLHLNTLNAAKIIGYSQVDFADFPDNRFDQVDLLDIVKVIECKVNEFKPSVIYTHHLHDLNLDHQYTHRAVITATRPINNCSVKEIYSYETLSSTEWSFDKLSTFTPNVFIDIEDTIEVKKEAMKCYSTELCKYPHPRSLEGIDCLAKNRGLIIGKRYVEAFECIRKIIE